MWTRSCFLLVAILGFASWSMAANLPLRNADQQVLAKLSTTWAGLPASWNADNTTMGCDWPGIICGPDYEDSSFSAVWFISVNQVTGPLISDIANLASLTQFNAQFSDFQNTPFPSEFGTLVNLTMINAFNNKIGGPLPDLSACQKLSFLNLALNNLGEFPAWIVNVPSLTLVGLDSNSMTGTIPQDIGDKLTKLTDFDVSTNQLTGDVPISFTNAKKLTNLKLDNNKFNCLPDQPSSFDFLDFCNGLQFCTFTDPGCPQYLRLNDAQYLVDLINQWSPNCLPTNWTVDSVSDACNIPFQGVTCNALWQLSGLVLIAPENTLCISVPPPASLFNATYLSTLAISGYAFNGTIPSTFSTTNIAKISLTNQFLTDPIPPINKKKLTTLDLSRNFFTAPPKAEDLKNSSLTSLNLANNLITGDLSFVPQNQLSALNVSINSFTGDLSFFNFKSTAGNLIDVSFNQLTGSIPSQFISMDYSYAVFNDNQFTGSLDFEELHSSGNILNLSNNQLSGTLSPMIYRYFVVKADNNQFTGSIPEVSPTHYNNYLSLTNNSLTGNVPASLSNNTFTTTIQLDNNAGLEGVIPEEISELTLLSVFTFSGTKLTCPNTDSWNKWVQTVVEITCKKPDDNGTDWFLWGSVAGILVIVAILVSLLIFLAWRNQKKNSGQYETV